MGVKYSLVSPERIVRGKHEAIAGYLWVSPGMFDIAVPATMNWGAEIMTFHDSCGHAWSQSGPVPPPVRPFAVRPGHAAGNPCGGTSGPSWAADACRPARAGIDRPALPWFRLAVARSPRFFSIPSFGVLVACGLPHGACKCPCPPTAFNSTAIVRSYQVGWKSAGGWTVPTYLISFFLILTVFSAQGSCCHFCWRWPVGRADSSCSSGVSGPAKN